jgi:hypothetical protein
VSSYTPRTTGPSSVSEEAPVTSTTTDQPKRATKTSTQQQGRLNDEQLAQVITLLKGADSVELKLSVPDSDSRSTVRALEMDPIDAQIRQVFFLDTPDLTLNKSGVVVRTRRIQRKPGDAIVKLRPVDPERVAAKTRKSPAFGIEVDAMPGGYTCSGTMKAEVDNALVKEAVSGVRPLSKLFTKEQRALYAEHAPPGVELDGLAVLGPITLLKLKFVPADFGRRLVAELWFYPDGSRILELSTKCAPAEAFEVAAQTRAYLAKHGVDLLAEQQTKTATALKYFVRELSRGT